MESFGEDTDAVLLALPGRIRQALQQNRDAKPLNPALAPEFDRKIALLLPPALGVLESFYAEPFPSGRVSVWYGFQLGSSGGGGILNMDDRATYQRRGNGMLPWDAIVVHELAHSFVAHESMTQFLELLHNVARHGTPLSAEAQRHFVDQAAPGLEADVAAATARIGA